MVCGCLIRSLIIQCCEMETCYNWKGHQRKSFGFLGFKVYEYNHPHRHKEEFFGFRDFIESYKRNIQQEEKPQWLNNNTARGTTFPWEHPTTLSPSLFLTLPLSLLPMCNLQYKHCVSVLILCGPLVPVWLTQSPILPPFLSIQPYLQCSQPLQPVLTNQWSVRCCLDILSN